MQKTLNTAAMALWAKCSPERVTLAMKNKRLPGKIGGHGAESVILDEDGAEWIRQNCPTEPLMEADSKAKPTKKTKEVQQ